MTPQERLEQQVEEQRARGERRKAEAEAQAASIAQAAQNRATLARRSCVSDDAEAVTPEGIAPILFSALTAGITPQTPAEEEARAWKTWIREELERHRIPARFRYRMEKWECVDQRKVFGLCRRALIGCGAIIAMIGARGTGKTTVALQIVIERAVEDWRQMFREKTPGYIPRWMPYRKMSDLIARFKLLYADHGGLDGESLIAARESLCRADLLIIDELHDCDDQKMKHRILTDFIDRRYSRMRDTILISNQDEEEFRATNSDSILSRIQEHGHIVPCLWESFRAHNPNMPAPKHA